MKNFEQPKTESLEKNGDPKKEESKKEGAQEINSENERAAAQERSEDLFKQIEVIKSEVKQLNQERDDAVKTLGEGLKDARSNDAREKLKNESRERVEQIEGSIQATRKEWRAAEGESFKVNKAPDEYTRRSS